MFSTQHICCLLVLQVWFLILIFLLLRVASCFNPVAGATQAGSSSGSNRGLCSRNEATVSISQWKSWQCVIRIWKLFMKHAKGYYQCIYLFRFIALWGTLDIATKQLHRNPSSVIISDTNKNIFRNGWVRYHGGNDLDWNQTRSLLGDTR